ncbi:MAG TPA: beta-ketoacyl synthase N-terminal-like domain-containing protein [Pyrinomonadaceae bacterium]|jgi:acyl transferase domain-containing protein/acyl-CoA synthetase (AMP-forming)/AMP-acid ligase II/acyl carrier protein
MINPLPLSNLIEPATLVELLRWRALHQPHQLTYTFLLDGEDQTQHFTYRELDHRARAIAAALQRLELAGERALLLFPPGLDYIAALFGCMYAGVVAVPAYPPRPNRPMPRIEAIVADAQASVALTNALTLAMIEKQFGESKGLASLKWVVMEEVQEEGAEEWREGGVSGESLAFLQYTSGSTSAPKGVMLSHRNLLYNLSLITDGFESSSESRGVIWLPPYHDMGLIGGILQPLYTGFPVVLMSPVHFLQHPMRWLQAISRHRATISGGPNFAYELCLRKATPEHLAKLDLSSWTLAFNGAEPIRPETLQSFAEMFEPCGFRREAFYPCYGLAEATLIVSGGSKAALPKVYTCSGTALERHRVAMANAEDQSNRMLVGCGGGWSDQHIRIVNPQTLIESPPDQVGEVWVSGPSIAQGYWNQPQLSDRTFRARLADSGDGPYLRTGDMGFLVDGELVITGRCKDLIIIAGRNHYPQDIERTVEQSHPALRVAHSAAFAVEVNGHEQLVVTAEVERQSLKSLSVAEVVSAIRRAVALEHEIQMHAVVLLKTGSIPKTSSGKIQRHVCRRDYESGGLQMVGEWRSERAAKTASASDESEMSELVGEPGPLDGGRVEEIQSWLVARISERLKVEPDELRLTEPFARYGMDSATAVGLTGELSDWLGRRLSPTLAYEYPTIKALARHLAEQTETSAASSNTSAERIADREPIAIIGIGCRFPGAHNAEAFWRLLTEGVDAITEVPADRWDARDFYDADRSVPGKMNTRWGGFLDQVDEFDPHFFGISPREAICMDPQQRLMLEVAWEALEDGGQSAQALAGTATGVFVGISTNDYGRLQLGHPTLIDAYTGTGNSLTIAANRLSYFFDFRGPSMAVDTACSSSLVAVHLACQSIWRGEAALALAGGVNLILSPAIAINFTKSGAMAPDGRCKTFDARADGYVRSEGAGLVLLKPLSRALADADPIYAVIRGSAINQDGRTNGLMAPNPLSQEAVLREAYRCAGVSPGEVQYIEAHGTGTLLGDPIEAKALGTILAEGRPAGQNCILGSVKTNIGHLEAAAGVAGLIKTALSLKHRMIPRSLHFQEPNPHIPFADLPLRVQQALGPWPAGSRPALAGVSSFGFGGTNSHVVLEEAPRAVQTDQALEAPVNEEPVKQAHLLPLSAHSPEALRSLAESYQRFLSDTGSVVSLQDMCYTASVRRSQLDYRLALLFHSREELSERLRAFTSDELDACIFSGRKHPSRPLKLVFVFSGQGPQWWAMGRELMAQETVFRSAIEECDKALSRYADWSLIEELAADEAASRLDGDDIGITQVALCAIQLALAALWRSWGIEPDAVVGHSMGEVAAAHVAGFLSLEDAIRVIFNRSRLLQGAAQQGAMAMVELSLEEAEAAISRYENRISIAASNGPRATVLSGEIAALDEVLEALEEKGIFCRRLRTTGVAAHSPQVEPFRAALVSELEGLKARDAKVRMVSTVTADWIEGRRLDADYWGRHLRKPVLFSEAVKRLASDGYGVFIEISPHPILAGAISECLHHVGQEGTVLPSLRRGQEERAVMLGSMGALYACGYALDWRAMYQGGGRCVPLPSYPWQRERFWFELGAEDIDGNRERPVRARSQAGRDSLAGRKSIDSDLEHTASQNMDDWLYKLEWQLRAREEGAHASNHSQQGAWLIFADGGGVGESLAARLNEHGESSVLLFPGERYERLDGVGFRVRPGQVEDVLEVLRAANRPAWRGALHLWSLDLDCADESVAASVEAAQSLTCSSVLCVIRARSLSGGQQLPRLRVMTRGAQPVGPEPQGQSVAQSTLWGLGRTIAEEHPAAWAGLIDLDPAASAPEAADLLCEELRSPDPEEQLAFRRGQRYVARLVRHEPSLAKPSGLKWQTDASYLITGGLGDLGLKVARWMVEQGARRLILMGRTKLPLRAEWNLVEPASRLAAQIAAVRELELLGASVHLAAVDVADERGLGSFLETYRREGWPPIRGVVHAAGVIEGGPVSELESAALMKVMRPKAVGGWLLHRLLADEPLDFFVLFSSASSLLNSPLVGAYAAANAFLDALAHHRRALGQTALSINWGFWSEVGMAARYLQENGREFAPHGMGTFTPQQGLEVMGRLMAGDATQVCVMPVNWQQWSLYHPTASKSPVLAHLIREGSAQATRDGSLRPTAERLTRDALLASPAEQRQSLLVSELREQVAMVLKLSASRINPELPLIHLGIDSIMAIELKNRIESNFGIALPIVTFLQGPSIDSIAAQMLDQLAGAGTSAGSSMKPVDAKQGEDNHEESLTEEVNRVESEALLTDLAYLADEKPGSTLEANLLKASLTPIVGGEEREIIEI